MSISQVLRQSLSLGSAGLQPGSRATLEPGAPRDNYTHPRATAPFEAAFSIPQFDALVDLGLIQFHADPRSC
jgi:hypothetical protein